MQDFNLNKIGGVIQIACCYLISTVLNKFRRQNNCIYTNEGEFKSSHILLSLVLLQVKLPSVLQKERKK